MKTKSPYLHRSLVGVITSTVIQQLFVAFSTYSLAMLSSAVVSGKDSIVWFGLFVSSLVFVYIPGALSSYFLEIWKQSTYQRLITIFTDTHTNQIHLYKDSSAKESRHSQFIREAWPTVESTLHYAQDALQVFLNVVFNIVAIGTAIDSRFIPAYGVSAFIVICGLRLTTKAITRRSERCQNARVAATDALIKGWDTLIIGNRYNLSLYNSELRQKQRACSVEAISSRSFMEIASISVTWIAMSPVLGLLCYIVFSSRGNAAILIAIFATLHRQILTLQHMQILVSSGLNFSFIKAQVAGVLGTLRPIPVSNLSDRISQQNIRIESKSEELKPLNLEVMTASLPAKGRLTIRGPNGAGKSSLLHYLKSNASIESFYLPSHAGLIFSADVPAGSTGQTLRRQLREIAEADNSEVLLLDEWDANLDDANMGELNMIIEKLAEKRLVIEVRHRSDSIRGA